MRTLVVATTNRGKVRELRALLGALPLDVRSIAEVISSPPVVVEDGATFEENAAKKAWAAARATGLLSLADDSGLEVDALGGLPGVRSARFAREGATDEENITAVLAALDRSGRAPPYPARFRCALALVDPSDVDGAKARLVEGCCEGEISRTRRGDGGFGYDPVFLVAGRGRTMAELGAEEKNRVSHRAGAAEALRPWLVAAAQPRA